MSEGLISNGKPDGYWKNYFTSGIIKNEGNRKNFLLDSTWIFYFTNGNRQRVINYKDGNKNGELVNYDTSGKIISKELYINNFRNGISEIYHDNGRVKLSIPYKNDRIHGLVIEYSDKGIIITQTNYVYGIVESTEKVNRLNDTGEKEGKWLSFYANGNVRTEENYRSGVLDGYKKYFNESGNLLTIEKFKSGNKIKKPKELKEIRLQKAFYPGGKLQFEGTFFDDTPHGVHFYYAPNGKIDSVYIYEEGYLIEKGNLNEQQQKTDRWIEYYLSGEEKGKGTYTSGKKTGEWLYYFPSGKIEQQGKYNDKGEQIGIWNWYYEDGDTLRSEQYINGTREGRFIEFFENGEVLQQGLYQNDVKEGFWYYKMGNYLEKGKYVNGEKDSLWVGWWSTTQKIRYKGKWNQGLAEGKHDWFYENGNKFIQGFFIGNEMSGEWFFYDPNNVLFLSIMYENGEEVGFNGIKNTAEFQKATETLEEFREK